MTDEAADTPDSTAVRTALGRALHVELAERRPDLGPLADLIVATRPAAPAATLTRSTARSARR
jgi:hypothetical protein